MSVSHTLTAEEVAAWQNDCQRTGRELPQPASFRKGPRGEDGKLLDLTRPVIAVYPDGTFPTAGMPPIFGTVCGSIYPYDPDRPAPTQEEADDHHVEVCFLIGCSPYEFYERQKGRAAHDAAGLRLAAEIRERYDRRVITNGNQLTAKQQELQDTALTLWMESRIGRAAYNRADSFDPAEEWLKLAETTRAEFLKQARKSLKPSPA